MKTTSKIFGIALVLTCSLAASLKAQQTLYVDSYSDGTIGEYGINGSSINASLISGLYNPIGMAVSGNDLYVANFHADQSSSTVGEYGLNGSTVSASLISLTGAYDVAVSGNNLLVSSEGGSPTSGTIGEYGLNGSTVNSSIVSGLVYPTGIAVSGNNLYALANLTPSGVNANINEYTTSGSPENVPLMTGLTSSPYQIAISGNDLFVVNYDAGTVSEYLTSGSLVTASFITGLNHPHGITVSGGDLFIASRGSGNPGAGTIGEYGLDGSTVSASLITGLDQPIGIVVVPEPTAGALAGLGAALVWLWRRCK